MRKPLSVLIWLDFTHAETVKFQCAGGQNIYFNTAAELQRKKRKDVGHNEKQKRGQVQRQGSIKAVGKIFIEKGAASDAEGLPAGWNRLDAV